MFFKSNSSKVTRTDIRKPLVASEVAAEPDADTRHENHDTDKDELKPGTHTFSYDECEIDDDAPTLRFQR